MVVEVVMLRIGEVKGDDVDVLAFAAGLRVS